MFVKWRTLNLKASYIAKVQSASQMVTQMSNFSRRFISLNSLEQLMRRNQHKRVMKAFGKLRNGGQSSGNNRDVELLRQENRELQTALGDATAKLQQSEQIF
jgi:biopolymer transport protein ExbB/TolQ